MSTILVLTVTLVLPIVGYQTTVIERAMPSPEQCHQVGRDLVAKNDDAHSYEFTCRAESE